MIALFLMYRRNYYHFLVLTLAILRLTEKLLIVNIQHFHALNGHKGSFLLHYCTP